MKNLKNVTIALMIALAYEILLKVGHLLFPSLMKGAVISSMTSVLFFIVGVIIILFLFYFYSEERSNKNVGLIMKILVVFFILNFLFRLPPVNKVISPGSIHTAKEIFGFITSILLFLFMLFYTRGIPASEKSLHQAATFVLVMFGIGVIKSLYSLVIYFRFLIAGVTSLFPPLFYNMMFVLFLLTHLSMIYFLYRYYQVKCK